MEVFREIDQRFLRLESATKGMAESFEGMQASVKVLEETTRNMELNLQMATTRVGMALEEIQGLRGVFASIEALWITRDARLDTMDARIRNLETKAS